MVKLILNGAKMFDFPIDNLEIKHSRNEKGGQTVIMDYKAELLRLEEQEALGASEFWQPEAGQHKVKALSEFEDAEPFTEEGKEPQLRKKLKVADDKGKEHIWTMPYGRTPVSVYGQLVRLGVAKENKLLGAEFTVVVVGTGQNKRFTIVI